MTSNNEPLAILANLLLSAKFSTATEISEASGRGVGLIQVKKTMDQIGGNIEVSTKKGEFTSFKLIIPLSVAITKVLLLSVKQNQLALPMGNIKQILSVPKEKIYVDKSNSSQSILLDENPVPLVDLRDRLNFNSSSSPSDRLT